ncbi:hypothetical protein Tco_1492585 [Tanacetum coccineum]
MGSRDINSETLHEVFVPQWNVSNDTLLDDHDISQEFIDYLAPPVLFAQIREMDYHHLFTEFNVGTALQACLNAEVRMQTEYCLSERRRLESECEKQADLCMRLRLLKLKRSLDGKVAELQSSVSSKDLDLKELSVVVSSLSLRESRSHVAAYNPSAEVDYTFALQRLCPLADAPGMSDLQPDVEQLTLPIHRPKDQVILSETYLLVALDVTHLRVERIRENVTAQRSALIGVWTPLVDLLSVENLVGTASTSNSMLATVPTTTNLSITFSSASTIPPITIKDYEIIGMDSPKDAQGSSQGENASFPNTIEFEKEELDTTPECDPPC